MLHFLPCMGRPSYTYMSNLYKSYYYYIYTLVTSACFILHLCISCYIYMLLITSTHFFLYLHPSGFTYAFPLTPAHFLLHLHTSCYMRTCSFTHNLVLCRRCQTSHDTRIPNTQTAEMIAICWLVIKNKMYFLWLFTGKPWDAMIHLAQEAM